LIRLQFRMDPSLHLPIQEPYARINARLCHTPRSA
jgi:hypothetical protein